MGNDDDNFDRYDHIIDRPDRADIDRHVDRATDREIGPEISRPDRTASPTDFDVPEPSTAEIDIPRAEPPLPNGLGRDSRLNSASGGRRSNGAPIETAAGRPSSADGSRPTGHSGSSLQSPVDPGRTRITSGVQASRTTVVNGQSRTAPHDGIDYGRGKNVPVSQEIMVRAAADGTVKIAGDYGTPLGNQVNIVHQAENITTRTGHLKDVFVSPGQDVKAGELIGTLGQTGRASGPHVHFEVRQGSGGTMRTTRAIPMDASTLERNWYQTHKFK